MTPNLKRLFAQAKQDSYQGELASDTLVDMFDRHGEALVDAIERGG